MDLLSDIVGWAGAASILGAYLATSAKMITPGWGLQVVNLLGACAFLLSSGFPGAWPSVATNFVWAALSVVGLWRMRPIHRARHKFPKPRLHPSVDDALLLPGVWHNAGSGRLAALQDPT